MRLQIFQQTTFRDRRVNVRVIMSTRHGSLRIYACIFITFFSSFFRISETFDDSNSLRAIGVLVYALCINERRSDSLRTRRILDRFRIIRALDSLPRVDFHECFVDRRGYA